MLGMRKQTSFALLAFTLGCGGNVGGSRPTDGGNAMDSSIDSGGTIDSGTPGDAWGVPADGGRWSPLCPETPPSVGSACSQDMLQCEYGDAWWNVACDTVVQCYSGQWGLDSLGVQPCLGKPGPNPPQCPTSGSIVNHTPCPNAGLTCNYEQGVVCQCFGSQDGGFGWDCPLDSTCPTSRPRLGAPCSGAQGCTYDLCAYSEWCPNDGGVWQAQPYNCQ